MRLIVAIITAWAIIACGPQHSAKPTAGRGFDLNAYITAAEQRLDARQGVQP